MGSMRTTSKLLRAAFAAVFGFMSLAHEPLMAFANANSVSPHQPATVADHPVHPHQQHADRLVHHQQHQGVLPPAPESPPDCDLLCLGLGCFQSMTPALADAPLLRYSLLERLLPAAPKCDIGAGTVCPCRKTKVR